MGNLQVKNVPADLHRRLRRTARRRGTTLREIVLQAVARELSHEEFAARLRRRRPVDLGRPAAELLREERLGRE
jgi:plasmid stability protein